METQAMVRITRVYTRTGDDGSTGIGDGSRVSKLDCRITAGGSVDETNCCLGMAAASADDALKVQLQELQSRLFDLGADLTCPWDPELEQDSCPRITAAHVEMIERQIDDVASRLTPLKSFVLPGGTQLSSCLHLARSVCRRAEIDVLRMKEIVAVNPQVPVFLNRLSDLLFVLARNANNNGRADVLWKPGVVE